MSRLGIGVVLKMLCDGGRTSEAIKKALNKEISNMFLGDNTLSITFTDGGVLSLFDDRQSCCESRYMRSDDNLEETMGEVLVNLEIKDGDSDTEREDEWGSGECHETQFLEVITNKGVYSFSNHVEHNGYYGGFSVEATYYDPKDGVDTEEEDDRDDESDD